MIWLTPVQRPNFLREQTKPVFIQPALDPLHPGHLADALYKLGIVGMIKLNAISTLLFRHIARHISSL